jgi:ElaB/YqjD/DUF883 family membrane-anchored ribosome-binding protein
MTSTRYINTALHHTAQDLRDISEAAKGDLQRLTREARILAESRVIEPTMAAMRDASVLLEKRAKDVTRYAGTHPMTMLAAAALGGVIVGLLMRRR